MSSFMTGVLAGVGGAASKYGEIQDQQNKFRVDEAKAKALDARKRSFAEFNHNLQDSGMVGESGRSLTNKQADEQAALGGPMKTRSSQTAQEKQDISDKARLEKPSGKFRKEGDKIVPLTFGELDEANKSGVEVFSAEDLKREETKRKEGVKETVTTKKEDENYKKDTVKGVKRVIQDQEATPAQAVFEYLKESKIQNDPRFNETPEVKNATKVAKRAETLMNEIENSGKELNVIKKEMEKAFTKAEVEEAEELLNLTGKLEKGWWWGQGYKGVDD